MGLERILGPPQGLRPYLSQKLIMGSMGTRGLRKKLKSCNIGMGMPRAQGGRSPGERKG